ncbi:MAG: DUF1800 family protein [Acidimicrobiales bacterium]
MLTGRQKARFLKNATFGVTEDLLTDLGDDDPWVWMDRQMRMPLGRRHTSWANEIAGSAGQSPEPLFGVMDGKEFNVNQMWRGYIEAPDQLRKRVGAALLEIFVVNARVAFIGIRNNMRATCSFVDMLEANAFGNFDQLLRSVAIHPAMGYFLSHLGNEKAEYGPDGVETRIPDENFAREILQLFTIGLHQLEIDGTVRRDINGSPIETYDQADIFNLARVFTGWGLDQSVEKNKDRVVRPMVANRSTHAPEEKRFLGLTIPAGTDPLRSLDLAIEHIANHANVGPFIAKLLIQRLVTANPSKTYIRRVAEVFNDNGSGVRGDMGAVIKHVLWWGQEATEMQPPLEVDGQPIGSVRGKVREPMVRLSAVARYLGCSSSRVLYPIGNLSDMRSGIGQSPLKSPSVFNFFRPGYVPPNSELAERGLLSPEFQITTGTQVIGSVNTINRFIRTADQYMQTDTARLEALAASPSAIVDDATLMLTGGRQLDRDYRTSIIGHVERVPASDRRRRYQYAVIGVASSPEFLIEN